MEIAKFLELHPKLYHMAEPTAWPSIQQHGLLSAKALVDLFEITNPQRDQLLSAHRPECVEIQHPTYGVATVRDQKPLRESQLRSCLLDGLTPTDWYRILNGKSFFWTTKERLLRLLGARAYRDKHHCVLTVDSKEMLSRHLDRITISPYNSGSTIYKAAPRGHRTFLPLHIFDYDEWKRRGRSKYEVAAELVVEYNVPDISEFTESVDLMHGPTVERNIYTKA